jgi:Na+-transporting NADH:ubiquinone oxidoreductase subunit A
MMWRPRSPVQAELTSGPVRPIRIVKGLDIPIRGEPEQVTSDGGKVGAVALLGDNYGIQHPSLRVQEGDRVKLGQPLFVDRKRPKVQVTSPGAGIVREINRGARRALQSIVIDLEGEDRETFEAWPAGQLADLRRDQVIGRLLESGLWAALRTRPYSKLPDPSTKPSSVFVTATDSNPLAARPQVIIADFERDFAAGLAVVSHLTDGRVFVCQEPKAGFPLGAGDNVVPVEFSGSHPSGLVGTHIHLLDPVNARKTVWHLGYQDVIAIGKLFTTGRIWTERIVALAGPGVKRPRLIRTRLGADMEDIARGELHDGDWRIISGSLLSGHHARGALGYLGRLHSQVSVVAECHEERPRNWPFPGSKNAYSAYGLTGHKPTKGRRPALTTASHGAPTAFVPLGGFERVMPLDILPTQLLRAILVGDSDMAEALGCLELAEEDLALCTFVCPSKIEYGPLLRACLDQMEKDR